MTVLVFLDIDGTLITDDQVLTPTSIAVVRRIKEELKIPVILTSARPPKGILPFQQALSINDPIIAYGGSLVVFQQERWRDERIDVSSLFHLMTLAQDLEIELCIYSDNNWWITGYNAYIHREEEIIGFTASPVPNEIDWTDSMSQPHKIMCVGDPVAIQKLEKALDKIDQPKIAYLQSKPYYLEVTPVEATKVEAVKLIHEHYGVGPSQILAVGDNYNDLEMIRYAGIGVAMGNAPEPVKSIADHVTTTNAEDGMAKALGHFLFNDTGRYEAKVDK